MSLEVNCGIFYVDQVKSQLTVALSVSMTPSLHIQLSPVWPVATSLSLIGPLIGHTLLILALSRPAGSILLADNRFCLRVTTFLLHIHIPPGSPLPHVNTEADRGTDKCCY